VNDWWIYRGRPELAPHDAIDHRLPEPPPWRRFDDDGSPYTAPADETGKDIQRAVTYRPDSATIDRVNAALYVRRPLLVTGRPGTGKSTLAYAVAHELGLGRVLRWPITSRVTLRDGLYQYDPLGRLYQASRDGSDVEEEQVGRYIRLGPLGTALLPHRRPRVLLIDEIDKGDLDLPNDLLTVFEEGEYEIPELARLSGNQDSTPVLTADRGATYQVSGGRVRCRQFPFVVLTSNREREFPPAFLRRCVQLELLDPGRDELDEIVTAHLSEDLAAQAGDLIDRFLQNRADGALATDQLLNAIYLTGQAGPATREKLAGLMMSPLARGYRETHEG
jgi:MoxR-like ATPase